MGGNGAPAGSVDCLGCLLQRGGCTAGGLNFAGRVQEVGESVLGMQDRGFLPRVTVELCLLTHRVLQYAGANVCRLTR